MCHGSADRRVEHALGWIQLAEAKEVEGIASLAWKAREFDLGGNFVMHDCFLVLANDVYSELEAIVLAKFARFRLSIFRR